MTHGNTQNAVQTPETCGYHMNTFFKHDQEVTPSQNDDPRNEAMQIHESPYSHSQNTQLKNQADGTISIQSNGGVTNEGVCASKDLQMQLNEPSTSY